MLTYIPCILKLYIHRCVPLSKTLTTAELIRLLALCNTGTRVCGQGLVGPWKYNKNVGTIGFQSNIKTFSLEITMF